MRGRNPWLKLSMDAAALSWESSNVMALRMMTFAAGGAAANAEAQRMVSEKVTAAMECQTQLALGAMTGQAHAGPAKAMAMYRRKVRANRRRLAKL